MCGIAGYAGSGRLDPERVARTFELMRHRGPDNSAHEAFDAPGGRRVELLHTRLNIIDLDPRADQPMRRGGRWIAYNGELYNYVEVRERLLAAGVELSTESDTEVMVSAIATFGWEALDGFEGMWAFASYDETSGVLSLCRDRFGEKPLYLYRDGDDLYFGSEVKFIAALLGRPLTIDRAHLRRYLVNGYKSLYKGNSTFFEGLEELPRASVIHLGRDTEKLETYWEPPAPGGEMSYEEAVSRTREQLIRSVELRLRADVPLAFCMSGGVDSMSLISIARRVFDYDVHGFTIVNTDERYEETDLVDYAIAELGIRHTAIPTDTRDFLPRLRQLIRHHDAPLYTITYFAHWLLMESIAEHGYRISVSGTAADELFSGYYDHHLAYLRQVHSDPELHQRSLAAWTEHVQPLVRNPFLRDPDFFVADPTRREHIYLDADEFASYLTHPFDEPFTEEHYTDDLLRNRMLNELFHEATPVILHEDDLNAMYFSIENRSPFLDRDLLELSLTIPTRHLVQRGMAKTVLRDSMAGIVPPRILESRRKVGFNAPILSFLQVEDPDVRDYLLSDSPVFDEIDRDRVAALLDLEFLPNSKSKLLFNFLNAKIFLEEFGG